MKQDPTKTLTLRNRASREIDARFNRLKRAVRSAFNPGGLIANVRHARTDEFQFVRDEDAVATFNVFLQEQIDDEILRIDQQTIGEQQLEDHWLNRHVGEGYRRGAVKTRLAAERAIPQLAKLPSYNPYANPAHVKRGELVFQRVFTDLEGVTNTMSQQMSRVLSNGIIEGKGIKEIARDLDGRVDAIGRTRAKLIARTEIVEAHNTSSILEAEVLEQETGVEIKMEWITSIDGRERSSHNERHQNIYTRKEAQELIGEPNCRCSVGPSFEI